MRHGILAMALITMFAGGGCGPGKVESGGQDGSGVIVDGRRIIEIAPDVTPLELSVYRGDYVQFVPAWGDTLRLRIVELEIDTRVPVGGGKPYVKFESAGTFAFMLGDRFGTIIVKDFVRGNYSELDALEAAKLLASDHPYLLDVRTQREYDGGRIAGAHLLPLASLQQEIGSLGAQREKPVLVYCRSGNRSTTAAKLLLDQGFKRVYNLRTGMVGWERAGLPVEH